MIRKSRDPQALHQAIFGSPGSTSVVMPGIPTLNPPPPSLPIVDDEELAQELSRIIRGTGEALIIANTYTVCLLQREKESLPWQRVCCGEFGDAAMEATRQIARKRLWWVSTDEAPWGIDPMTVSLAKTTLGSVRQWLRKSIDETGREGDVTQAIKDELTYLAAWRCQFSGCGRDLKNHGATGVRGRFSYFAHIVAASASGPRGDRINSKLLASEPSNFMLLCDECHRLIDKVNPAKYTVEVLRKMREASIDEVRRLLENLRYRSAVVIAIIGNVAGQPPQFSMDDAQEALWTSRLRASNGKPDWYFNQGGQHHDVHSPGYWLSLFQTMKTDLPRIQALLNGTSQGGQPRERLAVFPLHSTSVLLLAGRILGDMAGTHLFQPHRNRVGQGTRWGWPESDALPRQLLGKFRVEERVPHSAGQNEACLVVALTSDVPANRMPSTCATNGHLGLPTLRIVGPAFDKDCMQHPEDVQLLGLAVDAAVRRLQDEWCVTKVNLFVSAPTTAAIVVGQKMQARHQATYICHEAAAGPGSPYLATIEITSTSVRELVSGQAHSLSLQP